MKNIQTKTQTLARLLPIAAAAAFCFGLQGCINRDTPADDSGSTTGGSTTGGSTTGGDTTGGTTPTACANLPSSTTSYKGGDSLGEELTVSLNPSTLAYTINVDASVQRAAGTQRTGTLTQLDGCVYTSSENGAQFTIGANGVVQGGIATVSGSSFAPLLAFSSTYNNASTPTVFNDTALIFNAAGVQTSASTTASYGGSGRLRNAGTMQFCIDAANSGFATYAASCTNTQRGYITWNSTRSAFDFYDTTSISTSAVTTGGTLTGSIVIGTVGTTTMPLMLVRESATSYGMRLMSTQDAALADGAANGSYTTIDSSGSNADATLSGTTLTHGSSTGTLAYNTPANGVVQVTGTVAGYLLSGGGIYGFVPSGSGAAFELGLAN